MLIIATNPVPGSWHKYLAVDVKQVFFRINCSICLLLLTGYKPQMKWGGGMKNKIALYATNSKADYSYRHRRKPYMYEHSKVR